MRKLVLATVCVLAAAVAKADPQPANPDAAPPDPAAPPPSPFSDVGGVFDSVSQCWLWDSDRKTAMKTIFQVTLAVDRKCDKTALEGQAKVVWQSGPHDGETWDGMFAHGRFTGTSVFTAAVGNRQTRYVDGQRDGTDIAIFNDGGRIEEHYAAGLRSGTHLDIYPDGSKTEGQYENGKTVGRWTKTLRDGSRELSDGAVQKAFTTPLSYVAPDGKALPGVFLVAHIDLSLSPHFVYPPISVRLGEQGSTVVSAHVLVDGTAQDVRLIRSSGFQRLDEYVMTFMRGVHYQPATLDGMPMASYVIFSQNFRLRERE